MAKWYGLSSKPKSPSGFWRFMANFNINTAGFVIVGVFIVTWVIALGYWRYANVEQKWDATLRPTE